LKLKRGLKWGGRKVVVERGLGGKVRVIRERLRHERPPKRKLLRNDDGGGAELELGRLLVEALEVGGDRTRESAHPCAVVVELELHQVGGEPGEDIGERDGRFGAAGGLECGGKDGTTSGCLKQEPLGVWTGAAEKLVEGLKHGELSEGRLGGE
jgi:hypothetical protein